jgi:TonB family protein
VSEFDPSFRFAGPPTRQPWAPPRLALAAALVLHAAVALWLFGNWRHPPSPEAPVIVATLVQEPAPAPPAPAPPPPKPAEPPPEFAKRESGPDEKTTARAPAQEIAPEPEASPPAPPAAETTPATPPQPVPVPAPAPLPVPKAKPPPPAPRTAPRKQQTVSRAPALAPFDLDRAIGEQDETGDPYLNLMLARVERQRAPTTPIGSSGLHLEGITVFELELARSGAVERMALLRSSGSPQLDAEAQRMITAAMPFPPVPPDYPDHTPIKVTVHLFPQ